MKKGKLAKLELNDEKSKGKKAAPGNKVKKEVKIGQEIIVEKRKEVMICK